MSEASSPVTLELVETSAETGEQTVVGRLELAPDGLLKLLAAKEAHRRALALAVSGVNAKDVLHLETPPAPGTPKFAVASRPVAKGDEDYVDALREYFAKYYNLSLEVT